MNVSEMMKAKLRAFLKDLGMLALKVPPEETVKWGNPLTMFLAHTLDKGLDYQRDEVLLTGTQLRLHGVSLTLWCMPRSKDEKIMLSVGGLGANSMFPETVKLIEALIREYEFNER